MSSKSQPKDCLAPPEGSTNDKPADAAPKKQDVVLVHGVSEDGSSYRVLRAREDRLEAGTVRAMKDGESITGEVVKLSPREEAPFLFDVDVQLPAQAGSLPSTPPRSHPKPAANVPRKGPAQVASSSYRSNWDQIWARPSGKRSLPN